jgi:tRNA 2-thiouridine synthesizing protein A
MPINIKEDILVDVRGTNCPIPVLKANKALKEMESGQIVKIISTDHGSTHDIPVLAKQTGNELMYDYEDDEVYYFYVRKK